MRKSNTYTSVTNAFAYDPKTMYSHDTIWCMTWFVYAVLSAFLSSISSILEKKTLGNMHAIDFSAALALGTGLLSLPILLLSSWVSITPFVLCVIFVIALLASFAFIGVTRGVRHMDISTSSPLFLLSPFMTAFLAFCMLGEKFSSLQLGGIIFLALGIYVLETKHFWRFGEFLANIWGDKYTRFILFGLLLYALTSVGDRIMLAYWHVPPPLYTALIQLFIALHMLILTWYYRGSVVRPLELVGRHWKNIFLIAIFTTAYRIFQSEAIALAAVGLVAAVKRSSTLFTTIIGGELFHDEGLLRKSIACFIMIIGVYLIAT